MTSAVGVIGLTTGAERATTRFLITEPPQPPGSLVPVGHASLAAAQTTNDALRVLELKSFEISRKRDQLIPNALRRAGMAGWMMLPAGALAALAGVLGAELVPNGVAVCVALVGAAALGTASLVQHRAFKRWGAELNQTLEQEVSTIEKAFAAATGLEKAWIARRAAAVLECIPPHHAPPAWADLKRIKQVRTEVMETLGREQFASRLSSIADTLSSSPPKESVQLDIMHGIYRAVLEHPSDVREDGVRNDLDSNLELIMREIEQLTLEARRLLAPIISDAVIERLGRDPGNNWRIKRFTEELEGRMEPYSTVKVDLEQERLKPAYAAERGRMGEKIRADAATAIKDLDWGLGQVQKGRTAIKDPALAEQVAAAYEDAHMYEGRRQMRAALYQRADAVIVTVYNTYDPPTFHSETRWMMFGLDAVKGGPSFLASEEVDSVLGGT